MFDEEKTEKCQNDSRITFSSKIEIHEKDFTNFDLEILNEKVNLPYIIVSASKDNVGKIVDLSMNILKIFGYSKEELIGKNINILIPKLFHKIHDLLLIEQFEKDKLKLFDELNKRKIYFPNFIKKEIYGISKMNFLIELNINIYFVKTEKNKIIYIVEIENFNPFEIDLIKNTNILSKYCVLTDENFLIQAFTPNCLHFLKLTTNEINSNFSIINYIKQFHDDYLTAINNTGISKFSHINKTELILEDKISEQKSIIKNSILPNIKKKIKNELLNKKYSKKCKITWNTLYEINLRISKIDQKITSKFKTSDFSKSNIMEKDDKNNNNNTGQNLYMEIQKIIIKNKLFGYYFYFSKIKNRICNNMSCRLEKGDDDDSNKYLPKIKKYQYKFMTIMDSEDNLNKFQIKKENKNLLSSFIIKPPKFKDKENIDINNYRKKERKKSLDKNSKVTFKSVEDNNPINNCYYTNKYFSNDDDFIITGEFIPSDSSNFIIDLKNMSFIHVTQNNTKLEYLEILKKEAFDKINAYKKHIELFSKDSEKSNKSEEYESDDYSDSNSNMSINSSFTNSLSNSLYENIKNKSSRQNINKTPSNIHSKKTKKDIQNMNENSNDIYINNAASNSTKRLLNKNNVLNNFYKVKLNNIHYMVYDFNKDMIVEGNKNEIASKIETIMTNTKKMESNDLEKDERFSFIKSFKNKNKKNTKETNNIKNIENKNISQANNINEEKIFKKKIHEALNKHKDEPPIIKLKIFNILSYFLLIICGIIILSINSSYFSRINKSLVLFKSIFFIRYCSQISLYYLREMTLLNFVVGDSKDRQYYNIPAQDKEEYKKLIREHIMELFIENQSFMKKIYSSSLSYSKDSTQILSEFQLGIRMSDNPIIVIEYDILSALVLYNSAFYSLASSTSSINQNHTGLANYIYNNLNECGIGFETLIEIFQNELQTCLKSIILIVIIAAVIILIFDIIIFFLIMKYFISSITTRGNYMKVFYGINENILKNLIDNCENLMNKLKSSEEQRFYEEGILNESNEDKNNLEENNKKQNFSQNNNLNYDIEKKDKAKASSIAIIFIIIYDIFILISYIYFLFNGSYLIMLIKNAISVSNFCLLENNFHIFILEFFNIYREFLFDNQTIIHNMTSNLYLEQYDKKLRNIFKYLDSLDKYLKNSELQNNKTLCSYYINDFFDSSSECEEKIGLISTYNFKTFTYNFLEEIKISKNILKYKFENDIILGNLTEYNLDKINNELNSYEEEEGKEMIFRLDLFNNETLHFNLNIMFFCVILPYIEENRQKIYNILTIGKKFTTLKIYFIIFIIIVTLLYLCYFLPTINFFNKNIYITKNMLSIIPLNILAAQNDVSKLLNISKEK